VVADEHEHEDREAAWAHPGTRLAFWSHFTTPFAGTAFVLLWGMPFLTAGEDRRQDERA
jgi:hypothetical protein